MADPVPETAERAPWQIAEGRYGRPQRFRIGQTVRLSGQVRCGTVTGAQADPSNPGGVRYTVTFDSLPAEWLEAVQG